MNQILLPLRFAFTFQSWMLYAFAVCLGCACAQAQGAEGFPPAGQSEGDVDVYMVVEPPAPRAPDCDGWRETMRHQPSVVVGGVIQRRALSPAERSQLRQDVRGAYEDGFVTRSEAMGVQR